MAKFCSNCGKSVSEDVAFCDGCGNALNDKVVNSTENKEQQQETYKVPNIKTSLYRDEKIILQQTATSFNRIPRISGKMILTNQRLIWEKGGLANIVGIGLLSLAGDKYMCVPLSEIASINSMFVLGASGLKFSTKTGLSHKFSLNGLKHKESAKKIIDYISKVISGD